MQILSVILTKNTLILHFEYKGHLITAQFDGNTSIGITEFSHHLVDLYYSPCEKTFDILLANYKTLKEVFIYEQDFATIFKK